MKRRKQLTLKELTTLPLKRLNGIDYRKYTTLQINIFMDDIEQTNPEVITQAQEIVYDECKRVLRNFDNMTALEYFNAPLREAHKKHKTDTRSLKIRGL